MTPQITRATSSEDLNQDYSVKIEKVVKNGAISENEGKQQLLKMKLVSTQEKQQFNEQVRSVASKINQIKLYQFNNAPIEIQSK